MSRARRLPLPFLAATAFILGFGGYTFAPSISAAMAGCEIEGNISYTTGERIYQIPGGEYYDASVISPSKGERWFCSEVEAQKAGWRRSKR